jgi:tetratricopeptide (TPR) repeat protein
MKRIITIFSFLSISVGICAQTIATEKELQDYYENNIEYLQPLEGIYKITDTNNLFFEMTTNTSTRAFVYFSDKKAYEELCWDKESGKYKYLQDVYYDKSTHVFRYVKTNNQYIVNNPSQFTLNNSNETTYDVIEYTKLYPTSQMYAEAEFLRGKYYEANRYFELGNCSAAITVMNEVLTVRKGAKEYFYRASYYYNDKKYNAAIQDCNYALTYNIEPNNIENIYYLRGKCYFALNDSNSGINDMKKAGVKGTEYLKEYEKTLKAHSSPQKPKSNNRPQPNKQSKKTPMLRKTK